MGVIMSILESVPVIGGLIDKLSNGIDELVTSDEERGKIDIEKNQIELKRLTAELKEQHMQLQINMTQAQHPSIFVAGARPAIIWITPADWQLDHHAESRHQCHFRRCCLSKCNERANRHAW
jgi:hypothetical protein